LWKCINGRKLEQLHDNQSWMNYLHKIETFMSKLCFKISTHQIYNSWNTKKKMLLHNRICQQHWSLYSKELNNQRCNEITKLEKHKWKHKNISTKLRCSKNINPSGRRKILCWHAQGMAWHVVCTHSMRMGMVWQVMNST
jgi:hypothetical protein